MRGPFHEVIGLIPAAGRATRLAPLTGSKEILPIGFQNVGNSLRPKAICQYLLEKMKYAGITKVYMILREGKQDIPAYLGNDAMLGIELEYLTTSISYGSPFTLDEAYFKAEQALVAVGFPDMLFRPDDVYVKLLHKQKQSDADVVLGLFPADQPQQVDMVEFEKNDRVRNIQIKPNITDLHFTWGVAVWTPAFTQFMHEHLEKAKKMIRNGQVERELFIGDVIQVAIDSGMNVVATSVSNQPYLDIGTPGNLAKAIKEYS